MKMFVLPMAVAAALALGANQASAKVAEISFSGVGFTDATGLFATLPGLSWNGMVTLGLDATDDDPAADIGVYPSAVHSVSFTLPLLGLSFGSPEAEPVVEIAVSGNSRTLGLGTASADGDLGLTALFELTDLGSVFAPVTDALPQSLADFRDFDTLAFSLGFANLATGTDLGGFSVSPLFATLDVVETPLPGAFGLLAAGLGGLVWMRRRQPAVRQVV
jgi:hypothetical protein